MLEPRELGRERMAAMIAEEWARASELMAVLAERHGALYLHVLQPNQYFSGREFSAAERRLVLDPHSRFRVGAEAIYPLLTREGKRLPAAGVDFYDATGLFDDVPEPVYSDRCCHFNQLGNEMLAERVADRIRLALEARRPPGG